MSWNNRSYFSGQSGNSQYSSYNVEGYGGGGGQREPAAGGKNRPPSRLKKSGGKKAEEHYRSYTANTNQYDGYNDNDYNYNGAYSSGGRHNGAYGNGGSSTSMTPYYGGGYNNNGNSSYGNGGDGYTGGGAAVPYNAPAAFWAPQDGTWSPMFISTKEVNVYAIPGSQYDNGYSNDQKRRGGGGFFGPALEAVGHFFDRKFGFSDKD